MKLPDIQNERDTRGKRIQKVGVREYLAPIKVKGPGETVVNTVGNFSVYCSLTKDVRGANMSRFIQIINHAVACGVSLDVLDDILCHVRGNLGSEDAYVKVRFEYFMGAVSPTTEHLGYFHVPTTFEARLVDGNVSKFLTVDVDYTSCCPCSKKISKYGAHNQRSTASITVELKDFVTIEELVQLVNESVSCGIYPMLKRPDEKYVTEKAYSNPKFVEDTARDISLQLDKLLDKRISDYVVVLNHFESIHQHNAVCVLTAGRKLK